MPISDLAHAERACNIELKKKKTKAGKIKLF